MRRSFSLMLGASLALVACATIPKPAVMAEIAQVRNGPAALEAKQLAPGAFAHAEKLAREADDAFAAGDNAGAQLLGERAIAAYAHAAALARIARAEGSATDASAKLAESKKELDGLDADEQREAAEADALELRIKVARDAQAIQPSGKADPEREKARLAAARALAMQARLLCSAARLLAPATPGTTAEAKAQATQLDEATAAVGKLESKIGASDGGAKAEGPTPIDEASRVRAGCLAVLTAMRRAATPVTKAPGAGDALLAELSANGTMSPSRDDRGVVVTLRGVFKGNTLTTAGEAKLAELGRVAGAHPAFPVEIVLHADRAGAKDAEQKAQLDAAEKAMSQAAKGIKTVGIPAGVAAPLVDPNGSDKARNARLEIVFVTPESF